MSGDVQPRKRKDKKKRKEDGDPIPEKPHVPVFSNNTLNNEDVNIHVHKEGGTGGGICAKLVFFILFSALAVLIGLIITEHRGLTDLETIDPNSKFSQLFEGWVSTNNHDDHDLEAFEDDDHEDDHDEDHEDEDDHDEHDDDLDEHDDDHDEQDEETEEVEHSQEDEDDDQLEEPIEDEDNDDDDAEPEDQGDNDDEIDDDDVNTQENESVEETREEEDDTAASQEDDIEHDEDNDDDDGDEHDQDNNNEEQVDNEDDVDDQDTEEQDEQDDHEQDSDEDVQVSREKRDISSENIDEDDKDDIFDDNKDQDKSEIDNEDDGDDVADQDEKDEDEAEDQVSDEKEEDKDEISDEKDDDIDETNVAEQKDADDEENKDILNEKVKPRSKEIKTEKQDDENADENALGGAGSEKLPETRDSDSDRQSDDNEDYEYTNITNKDDHNIRQEIDEAQSAIQNNTSHAIALFDKILQKFPSSPRSLYGKALALDLLADKKRSNEILEKSLQLYVKLLKTDNVPEPLFLQAADRCIERMRFLGQYKNAIIVHNIIIDKFPKNPKYLNALAVTYLTIGRTEQARTVLKQILTKWPANGFALVHYGFILKTVDNDLEKAIRYLTKGIRTREEGVIDGRFYFHLGDALVRLGRHKEAEKIYEEGTSNKVFLSKYQRSLYNVPRLSGKPWWNVEELPKSLKLLTTNWKKIREEGLSILSEKGYFKDESENLRDTGEWKQFELYVRGQKNVNNCKKCPFTCNIISQIIEAKGCKRGQTKFSVMHPGTHVWPHCGPTNCRLRVHLGLKVPSNTFIRVAEDTKSWKEGEIFVFDDSFEHEVWHNGTDFRLVLIVDIWHPELTPSEKHNLLPI